MIKLADAFDEFYIHHVTQYENVYPDALESHELLRTKTLEADEVHTLVMDFEPRDWCFIFVNFALYGTLPNNPKEVTKIKKEMEKFHNNIELHTLYYKAPDGVLLCCLSQRKEQAVLKKTHGRTCDAY